MKEAIANLEKFWLVGVVEQYAGFAEVLQRLVDPLVKHSELWEKYSVRRANR